jgi:hypothetical protein
MIESTEDSEVVWDLVDPTEAMRKIQGTAGEVATLRDFVIELHGLAEGLANILIAKEILTVEELQAAQYRVTAAAKEAAKERRRQRYE